MNAPIDDIPNYKSILADLIQNEIIIKTAEGYTLNVYVTVIPDFMDSNDPLWYETGEHFSQNNLRVFKSFAHPTRKIIDNLENDIVAFLRKKIPPNGIVFLSAGNSFVRQTGICRRYSLKIQTIITICFFINIFFCCKSNFCFTMCKRINNIVHCFIIGTVCKSNFRR